MYQYVLDHPGATVSSVASGTGMLVPLTSLYLRALSARGLLVVQRDGPRVYYRADADPTVPEAVDIVAALRAELRHGPSAHAQMFRDLTAFTHPSRILIVQALAGTPGLTMSDLRRRIGISEDALRRHVNKLDRRGYLSKTEGVVRRTWPKSRLAATLLRIALDKIQV